MEEFNTIEKVIELFNKVGCFGYNNCYIYVTTNYQTMKSGYNAGAEEGMKAARENRGWEGYLINTTETGLGIIPLKNSKPLLFIKPENMSVHLEAYSFFNYNDIESIKVKKLNFFSTTAKDVRIRLKNGIEYKLIAKNKEKLIPYHADNFEKFVKKFK